MKAPKLSRRKTIKDKLIKELIKFVCGLLAALFVFFQSVTAVYDPLAPGSSSDEAKTLRSRWKTGAITVAVSSSLTKTPSNFKLDSDVIGAMRRSIATWENVADIRFNEISSDKQSVSAAGNFGDGVSLVTVASTAENVLMFGGNSTDVPAKTRVFYNRKGIITEADIVLNPYAQFSTDGTYGTFDLEAVLTHEIGHLLGLEHSPFANSTMQMHQGKNGIYNMPQIAGRTLSDTDIADVRALYGAKAESEDCCGSLKGKITLSSQNLAASGFYVWLEDFISGKVKDGTVSLADGTFSMDGLTQGKYRVFAQDSGERQKNRKQIFSGVEIGEIVIEKGKIVNLEKQFTALKESSFKLDYIGFNGQISDIPIPVSGGRSFIIFLGGQDLNPKELTVSTNSPFITVVPQTISSEDFGDEISVLSFEIFVKSNAPIGEYSLRVQKNTGETKYFVGGILNTPFINPVNRVSTVNFE